MAGNDLGERDDTLVFLDEIQSYLLELKRQPFDIYSHFVLSTGQNQRVFVQLIRQNVISDIVFFI